MTSAWLWNIPPLDKKSKLADLRNLEGSRDPPAWKEQVEDNIGSDRWGNYRWRREGLGLESLWSTTGPGKMDRFCAASHFLPWTEQSTRIALGLGNGLVDSIHFPVVIKLWEIDTVCPHFYCESTSLLIKEKRMYLIICCCITDIKKLVA
jgi:hypothetical protein